MSDGVDKRDIQFVCTMVLYLSQKDEQMSFNYIWSGTLQPMAAQLIRFYEANEDVTDIKLTKQSIDMKLIL